MTNGELTKRCSGCKIEKALDCFSRHPTAKFGRTNKCKDCVSLEQALWREKNKERCKQRYNAWRTRNKARNETKELPTFKRCEKCGVLKVSDSFYRQSDSLDGLKNWCKTCWERYRKEYRSENRTALIEAKRKKYHEKIANGFCHSCSNRALEGRTRCSICTIAGLCRQAIGNGTKEQAKYLLGKLEEGENKCPYTGEVIELGKSAELDHIYPKLRFPERAREIENLEWVSSRANKAKLDMTKEEFIEFCRLVTTYTRSEE